MKQTQTSADYARIGERYFYAERETTASNSELLKELQETLNKGGE